MEISQQQSYGTIGKLEPNWSYFEVINKKYLRSNQFTEFAARHFLTLSLLKIEVV